MRSAARLGLLDAFQRCDREMTEIVILWGRAGGEFDGGMDPAVGGFDGAAGLDGGEFGGRQFAHGRRLERVGGDGLEEL